MTPAGQAVYENGMQKMKKAESGAGAILQPAVTLEAGLAARLLGLADAIGRKDPAVAERLAEEVDRAVVVSPEELPDDVVTLGSAVTFRDETSGSLREVVVVLPQDADIESNRVSILTPIGAALIGLREGASIDWAMKPTKPIIAMRPCFCSACRSQPMDALSEY